MQILLAPFSILSPKWFTHLVYDQVTAATNGDQVPESLGRVVYEPGNYLFSHSYVWYPSS